MHDMAPHVQPGVAAESHPESTHDDAVNYIVAHVCLFALMAYLMADRLV